MAAPAPLRPARGGSRECDRVPAPWRHLFRFAHGRSLARADRIVAYRPKSREDLRAAGVPERRLSVLPLAIETWDDASSKDEARRRLGLPADSPIVLSVSRLTAAKEDGRPWKTEMVVEVVRALADLPPPAMLLVVGDGSGRARVESAARDYGVTDRIRLAGAIDNADLPAYYAACDVFALPDLRDFPWLAVLEAQSCGRPVVTTNTRAARLTVHDGHTGLLAEDLEEFRTRLRELVADRDRCRELGAAGPDYVRRFHSLLVRLDQIESLLEA